MTIRRIVTIGRLAGAMALLVAGPAWAQLKQPRCGGWPAGDGVPGVLIGEPGSSCFGLYFDRPRRNHLYGETRLKVSPQQGRFRVLNETEFEYTASPRQQGWDRIVVQITVNGVQADREFRATTSAEYVRLGGSATSPPPGMAVNRWGN